jgi:hypothetical protein
VPRVVRIALALLGAALPMIWIIDTYNEIDSGNMPTWMVLGMVAGWFSFGYEWGRWRALAVASAITVVLLLAVDVVAELSGDGSRSGEFQVPALFFVVLLPAVWIPMSLGVLARRRLRRASDRGPRDSKRPGFDTP